MWNWLFSRVPGAPVSAKIARLKIVRFSMSKEYEKRVCKVQEEKSCAFRCQKSTKSRVANYKTSKPQSLVVNLEEFLIISTRLF